MISVEEARELLLYSQNSDEVSPTFEIDFVKWGRQRVGDGSSSSLEFLGEVLKYNTRIQKLVVKLGPTTTCSTTAADDDDNGSYDEEDGDDDDYHYYDDESEDDSTTSMIKDDDNLEEDDDGEEEEHDDDSNSLRSSFNDIIISDILCFVSNNPSLHTLEIQGNPDIDGEENAILGRLFLDAAAQNPSIKRIIVGYFVCESLMGYYYCDDDDPPIDVSDQLKELQLYSRIINDRLVDIFPKTGNQIDTVLLRLDPPNLHNNNNSNDMGPKQTISEYQGIISRLLTNLQQRNSNNKFQSPLKHLELHSWCPGLPGFLFSPNTHLETIRFVTTDFSHCNKTGSSAMDGLLWGLMGSSKTTTTLQFHSCRIDSLAIEKLLQAIQHSDLINVRHLEFHGMIFVHDDQVTSTLTDVVRCQEIQSLSLMGSSRQQKNLLVESAILAGLSESSTISTLRFSTTSSLALLQSTLKEAMTAAGSLRRLEIDNCCYKEDDIDCIVGLIRDDNCLLEHLSLCNIPNHYDEGGGSNDDHEEEEEEEEGERKPISSLVKVYDALEKDTNVQSLRLNYLGAPGLGMMDDLCYGIGKLTNVRRLQLISRQTAMMLPRSAQDDLAMTIQQKNWSLEEILLVCCSDGDDYQCFSPTTELQPVRFPTAAITPATQQKIDAICQRNKYMNQINSMSVDLTVEARQCWIDSMFLMSMLPDGLNLVFSLLQRRPGCFF